MKRAALALAAALGIALVLVIGEDIVTLFSDPARVRAAIQGMGVLAPLALVALSALQIVLAPIPGYLVQIAGGYLFGAWQGSIYGIIGMLLGAAGAFLLARRFGVPLLQRLVPAGLLDGWLRLRNLSSLTVWVVILLLPVGDFCYFLAGLTALSLPRMLLATLLVRGPTVIIASLVGAQVAFLPPQWLWLLVGAVVLVSAVILWQKDRLEMLVFDRLLVRVLRKRDQQNGKQDENSDHSPADRPR